MFQDVKSMRCDEFLMNPSRNPYTGYHIKPGSNIYNRLVGECGQPIKYIARNHELEFILRKKLRNVKFKYKNRYYMRGTPHTYVDVGDVDEIAELIMEGHLKITVAINNSTYYITMIEYLMSTKDFKFMTDLVHKLGFIYLRDKIHVLFNLVYFLIETKERILTDDEIAYISGQPVNVLHYICPYLKATDRFNYDREGMLFSMTTGYTVPKRLSINNPDRYIEVTKYPPLGVWHRSRHTNTSRYATISPYDIVANMNKTVVENIFMSATIDNVDELIDRYGVVVSRFITDKYDKFKQALNQIANYEYVFARDPNISSPPRITDDNREEIRDILREYTTRELIESYEHDDYNWRTRDQLISGIIEASEKGPVWSWRHKYCQNDDSMNIAEFERHWDINKDDPIDPTLSYGVQNNYRCYQVNEIIEMLNQYPNEFIVPDVNLNINIGIDTTTRLPYTNVFPQAAMRQLIELLSDPGKTPHEKIRDAPNILELREILSIRLPNRSPEADLTENLLSQFNNLTSEQQFHGELFIAWIFLYGNWMRFWKGPNNEWPYETRVDNMDICIPASRDEHIFIQNTILNTMMETFRQDPELYDWIRSFRIIRYNFIYNIITGSTMNVIDKLNEYLIGDACMGFGGDDFLQTGYYLITEILSMREPEEIDSFLMMMLPLLLDMEIQVVNSQLAQDSELMKYIRDNPQLTDENDSVILNKLNVLNERKISLSNPVQRLYHFDPKLVKQNRHVSQYYQ